MISHRPHAPRKEAWDVCLHPYGIPGLSFDRTDLFRILPFCLILLLTLSSHSSANGPFSRLFLQIFSELLLCCYYYYYYYCSINPFTAPACKMSGLKDARTRLRTVYFPVPWQFAFNAIRFDENLFTYLCKKRRLKDLRVSNLALLLVVCSNSCWLADICK